MLDLKADIGIGIFVLFLALAFYIRHLASKKKFLDGEVLPDPDRSVKRETQIADEMARWMRRVNRQG